MQNAVCKVLTCRYARKGMKEEMSLPPAWVMTTGMRRRADSTSPTTDTRPVSHTGEHMVTDHIRWLHMLNMVPPTEA